MITNYPIMTRLGVAMIDTVVTIASFIAAGYLRNYALDLYTFGSVIDWKDHWGWLIVIILVWRGLLGYQNAYFGQRFTSLKTEIFVVIKTVFFGTLAILTLAFAIKSNIPRSFIFFFAVINLLLLMIDKIILNRFIGYVREMGRNIKNVLVLGAGDVAGLFIESVKKYPDWGIRILGLICYNEEHVGERRFGCELVGHQKQLRELLHRNHISELIVALPAKHIGNIENVMGICDEEGVPVKIVSPLFKNLISKAKTDTIHGLPVIKFTSVERNEFEAALKRLLDIVVSFISLVLLIPVCVVIALLIKLDSPGTVFYRWKIIGINRRKIISYKFRTMVANAEEMEKQMRESGINEMKDVYFKVERDPRISKLGRYLRKFSLDELPSLYSVLKGDMSLVGPRPIRWHEYDMLKPWHNRIFTVKPGITSLWVVRGKNKINGFDEIAKMNIEYIEKSSSLYDLKLIFQTIIVVLLGRNY